MVSFVCNACQETLKKPKLEQHTYRCYHAHFSCIDCNTDFQGTEYKAHTSCISEAEKYQKSLYKGNKGNNKQPQAKHQNQQVKAEVIAQKGKESNKRQAEESSYDQEANKKHATSKTASETPLEKWSKDSLPSQISEAVQLAIKEILSEKSGLKLSKLTSKVYKLIKKHPKNNFKKDDINSQVMEQAILLLKNEGLSISI